MTVNLEVVRDRPVHLQPEDEKPVRFFNAEVVRAVSPRVTVTPTDEGAIITAKDIDGETSALLRSTANYEALVNKPSIEGVELVGDSKIERFGVTGLTSLEAIASVDKAFDF